MTSNKHKSTSVHTLEERLINASEIEVIVMQGNVPFITNYLIKQYGLKKALALDVAKQMVNRPDVC